MVFKRIDLSATEQRIMITAHGLLHFHSTRHLHHLNEVLHIPLNSHQVICIAYLKMRPGGHANFTHAILATSSTVYLQFALQPSNMMLWVTKWLASSAIWQYAGSIINGITMISD